MSWIKKHGEGLLKILELLENSNQEDVFSLIKKIEKESRGELGVESVKFFSRPDFIQSLINIGNKYVLDEKVLEYVIRTITTISKRCSLEMQKSQGVEIFELKNQNTYDFLFKHKDSSNKKIKTLILYTIPFFPQFDMYSQKWGYILSIPETSPKRDSMIVFRWIIEYRIAEIPSNLKDLVIDIFKKFIKKQDLDIDTHQSYINVIKKLSD